MLKIAKISLEYPPALDSTDTRFPSAMIFLPFIARSQTSVVMNAARAIWLAILSLRRIISIGCSTIISTPTGLYPSASSRISIIHSAIGYPTINDKKNTEIRITDLLLKWANIARNSARGRRSADSSTIGGSDSCR